MEQMLRELCAIDGTSGREHAVRTYILDKLSTYPTEKTVTVDPMGNVLVYLKGEQTPDKRLMLAAHMDEVGLIITYVEDDGTLRFAAVGGIDEKALYGKRVRLHDRIGIIGGKATHQCSADEKKTVPSIDGMRIDLGFDSKTAAESVVQPGDTACFVGDWLTFGDHKIKAKALDDRAGCALLLTLAQTTPAYDMVLAFTVQEEVGLRGARTAAFTVDPDIAIVVDVTTAADITGVSGADRVCCQGNGPVVSFMDNRTLYDRDLYDRIMALAHRLDMPVQTKSRIAGGNDAGAIQTSRGGVRIAAISLPGRYIHSSGSVIDRRDLTNTAILLRACVAELLGDAV